MLKRLLRATLKPLTLRIRWYLQAEIMAELTTLRTQLTVPNQALEHALLTLAVSGSERKQGQGALSPGPPPRAQPLEPGPGVEGMAG